MQQTTTHRTKWKGVNSAFIDLLFILLAVFMAVVVLLTVIIGEEKKKSNIEKNAEFMVRMTWDDDSADDIDLWGRGPDGQITYYNRKYAPIIKLEGDDTGKKNDTTVLNNGEEVTIRLNEEIMNVRGVFPGTYIFNVNYYQKANLEGDKPIDVTVELIDLNPSFKKITTRKLTLTSQSQSLHAFTFDVLPDGSIINLNYDPIIFVDYTIEGP